MQTPIVALRCAVGPAGMTKPYPVGTGLRSLANASLKR